VAILKTEVGPFSALRVGPFSALSSTRPPSPRNAAHVASEDDVRSVANAAPVATATRRPSRSKPPRPGPCSAHRPGARGRRGWRGGSPHEWLCRTYLHLGRRRPFSWVVSDGIPSVVSDGTKQAFRSFRTLYSDASHSRRYQRHRYDRQPSRPSVTTGCITRTPRRAGRRRAGSRAGRPRSRGPSHLA
jgi:hypothetical protein